MLSAHWSGTRAGPFLQRLTKGRYGLLEPFRPARALAKGPERNAEQIEGCSARTRTARAGQHAPRHFNGDLKREIDPFLVTLREERVPLLPKFWRPGRISIRGLQGRDGLDPSCHGHGITAKQILLDARFQQGFPRSLQGLAPLRVPLVEFGESLIHGLGTAVEIAFLGRFGDPF
jgi:hypothetical protein